MVFIKVSHLSLEINLPQKLDKQNLVFMGIDFSKDGQVSFPVYIQVYRYIVH